VASPVCVNSAGAVMLGRVIVRMCMEKRRRQGGALDSEREHDSNSLPHSYLIVGDTADGVKGLSCRRDSRSQAWQDLHTPAEFSLVRAASPQRTN